MEGLYDTSIACSMVRDSHVRTFSHGPENMDKMAEIRWQSAYRITVEATRSSVSLWTWVRVTVALQTTGKIN